MLLRRKELRIKPLGGPKIKVIQTGRWGKFSEFHSRRIEAWRTSDIWVKRLFFCLLRLHEEILDFYNFMKPRTAEHTMRQEVIARVQEVIRRLWPTADVRMSNIQLLLLILTIVVKKISKKLLRVIKSNGL